MAPGNGRKTWRNVAVLTPEILLEMGNGWREIFFIVMLTLVVVAFSENAFPLTKRNVSEISGPLGEQIGIKAVE